MKLWHVSQDVNTGYDTWSDFVCAAETEEEARDTWPRKNLWSENPNQTLRQREQEAFEAGEEVRWAINGWAPFESVKARLIGEAVEGTEAGVICDSFHAG